jgi:hypothetical protein
MLHHVIGWVDASVLKDHTALTIKVILLFEGCNILWIITLKHSLTCQKTWNFRFKSNIRFCYDQCQWQTISYLQWTGVCSHPDISIFIFSFLVMSKLSESWAIICTRILKLHPPLYVVLVVKLIVARWSLCWWLAVTVVMMRWDSSKHYWVVFLQQHSQSKTCDYSYIACVIKSLGGNKKCTRYCSLHLNSNKTIQS